MTDYKNAKRLIKHWLQNAVVDGIDFWGPKLILGESANVEDNLILLLEGLFTVIECNEPIPNNVPSFTESERLAILCSQRRKRITDVVLIEETLDLVLTFEDGKRLIVFGDFGDLEAWQVKLDNTDFSSVIACPNKELAIWEREEKEKSHVRVELCFYHDNKAFNLDDFSKHFSINKKRSWSLGDRWKDMERLWSAVTIEEVLVDEQHLNDFFSRLEEKKEEIDYLRDKYEASITVEFVVNMFDNELPYISLSNKQLQFLANIGAEVGTYLYDYRES